VLSYERDRVRFLLKAYLRARLEKVQQFAGALPHGVLRLLCCDGCGMRGVLLAQGHHKQRSNSGHAACGVLPEPRE
jgi:hypothetical protein